MKKIISLLLTFLLFFSSVAFADNNQQIQVNINDEALVLDVGPTIIDGRTVLPVRLPHW